jgi:hypothetical protein
MAESTFRVKQFEDGTGERFWLVEWFTPVFDGDSSVMLPIGGFFKEDAVVGERDWVDIVDATRFETQETAQAALDAYHETERIKEAKRTIRPVS